MKTKPCDLCSELAAVRYRIQHDERRQWQLACPSCQAKWSADNPHYRYGGTWKAKRRKH